MKKPAAIAFLEQAALRLAPLALVSGCGRAPSFNILGSFFPAWLICMAVGITLAGLLNWVLTLNKLERNVPWGIVTYPSIAAFFAFTMWLIFFA